MVSMITGMSARAESAFSAERTAHPSIPGIMTSSVIASGRSSRARRRPSSPLAATTTRKPSRPRKRCIRSRTAASSSITSTVPMVAAPGSADTEATTGSGSLSETSVGSRMVNVLPRPASLSTVTSPPIIRQSRRLSARPSPVPPYFRVVAASACEKASNSRAICSGVIPMPVSRTRNTIDSGPPRVSRLTDSETVP